MYRLLPLLVALLIVGGCAAPPAAPTSATTAPAPTPSIPTPSIPTPVPTLAPTTAPAVPTGETSGPPTPTGETSGPPAPTAAPTASARAELLPAPLYVLDNGQIARVEADGEGRSLVTSEEVDLQGLAPIASFIMAPGGDLAFIVGDLKADRLVFTGPLGDGRRIIYEQVGHELSDLAWSPDGDQIYLRLLNNREPPDTPSGVYRIAAAGGQPELLRADDPVDDIANPAPTISGYRPFSTSPDGSRLLVEIYSLYYDGCGLGVMPAGGGDIVRLEVPPGTQTYCGEAAWSPDGASVYFLAGPDAGPTIWRGDTASGATSAMMAADTLARAPHVMSGGALRFFLVSRESDGALRFALAELAAPQAAPTILGPPFSERLGQVLWAPDGGGAVAAVVPPDEKIDLRWVPVDGQQVALPNTKLGIAGLAWGP